MWLVLAHAKDPGLISVMCLGVLGSATACSGGGDNKDGGTGDAAPETGKKPLDSGTPDASDAGVTCTANPSYTESLSGETANYTPTPADAGADAGPEDFYIYQGAFNTDQDVLDIELYDGFGAFTSSGIVPGTYNLTGDDLDYATCGLCVLIIGDQTQSSGDPYMATSGSITITSVSPTGTFAGTGTNLKFQHVSIAQDNTMTPVNDGCKSSVASVSFSAAVTQQ